MNGPKLVIYGMLLPCSDDAEVVEQPGTELPRVPEVAHRRGGCIRDSNLPSDLDPRPTPQPTPTVICKD